MSGLIRRIRLHNGGSETCALDVEARIFVFSDAYVCVCEYIIFWKIDDCNVHVTAEIQLGILRDFSSIRKYKIFLP
jgi:hypothetical protein